MNRCLAAFAGVFCFSLLGCGYHTVGHSVTIPQSVHTIAIPAFVNTSQTYRIEQTLTAAVVHEFTLRTPYRISYDAGGGADATLKGIVLSTAVAPTTYDSQTGRASTVLIAISMSVSLTDRQGKVLYQNPSYLFRDSYQVSQDLDSFFQEDTPAWQRLSREFARTLVSNILESY